MTDRQSGPALPAEPGRLFGDGGVGRTLPVALPAGRLVWPGGQYRIGASGRDTARPAYWLSEQPATAALWRRLRAEQDRSGLWPLPLDSLNGQPKRPWIVAEVDPKSVDAIDADDPEEFLATLWTDWVEFDQRHPELLGEVGRDLHQVAPFGRAWPGLPRSCAAGKTASAPGSSVSASPPCISASPHPPHP